MENLRKTLAYKICGILFYLLVPVAVVCAVSSMHDAAIWKELSFVLEIFYNLMFIPIIILPLFFLLLIFTNNKSYSNEFSTLADIGFSIIIILSIIDLFTLCSALLYGIIYLIRVVFLYYI